MKTKNKQNNLGLVTISTRSSFNSRNRCTEMSSTITPPSKPNTEVRIAIKLWQMNDTTANHAKMKAKKRQQDILSSTDDHTTLITMGACKKLT